MKRYTLSFDVLADCDDSELLEALEQAIDPMSFQLPYSDPDDLEILEETTCVASGLTEVQALRRNLVALAVELADKAVQLGKQTERVISSGGPCSASDYATGKETGLMRAAAGLCRVLGVETPAGVSIEECIAIATERDPELVGRD